MSVLPREILQIEVTSDLKKIVETEARRLNLTIAAYFEYLVKRQTAGIPAEQFDRVVNEVFGRYGGTMRKLAE